MEPKQFTLQRGRRREMGEQGVLGAVAPPAGAAGSWSALLSFSSQYMAFFEFNNRLEAILSKAYIYR